MNSSVRHHHRNYVQHEPFDLNKHRNLLIDILNLPPTTNAKSFKSLGMGNVLIPSFLYCPMVALYEKAMRIFHPDSFDLDEIGTEAIIFPTPYNPRCAVCEGVRFFLDQQINDNDKEAKAKELPASILFEICREIWVRLNPKPLRLNADQLEWAKEFNIIQLLDSPVVHLPGTDKTLNLKGALDRMVESAHWTNAIAYQTSVDLRTFTQPFMRSLTEFLFHEFLVLIRIHTTKKLKDSRIAPIDPHYILIAALKLGDEYIRPILKLVRAVAASLMSVYEISKSSVNEYFPDRDTMEVRLLKEIALMNIFLTNRPEAFSPRFFTTAGLIHKHDCTENPDYCYCRYTRQRYAEYFFRLK